MLNLNKNSLEKDNKYLKKLKKKRKEAFLVGRTKRIITLDRRIAELEQALKNN